MIAGDYIGVLLRVIQAECEYAVQLLQKVCALVLIEREYDLAVRFCLKLVAVLILLADVHMVIYLAVDSQHQLAVGAVQRLLAGERIDYGEALMADDGIGSGIDSRPVGTSVTDLLAHGQDLFSVAFGI